MMSKNQTALILPPVNPLSQSMNPGCLRIKMYRMTIARITKTILIMKLLVSLLRPPLATKKVMS
jgi:hypothetical protein